jgi:hypothetical protein
MKKISCGPLLPLGRCPNYQLVSPIIYGIRDISLFPKHHSARIKAVFRVSTFRQTHIVCVNSIKLNTRRSHNQHHAQPDTQVFGIIVCVWRAWKSISLLMDGFSLERTGAHLPLQPPFVSAQQLKIKAIRSDKICILNWTHKFRRREW